MTQFADIGAGCLRSPAFFGDVAHMSSLDRCGFSQTLSASIPACFSKERRRSTSPTTSVLQPPNDYRPFGFLHRRCETERRGFATDAARSTYRPVFLQALVRLVQNDWHGVAIEDLTRIQLSHFAGLIGSRIAMHGPRLRLNAASAQAIGLALHELATNAGKYGALSD